MECVQNVATDHILNPKIRPLLPPQAVINDKSLSIKPGVVFDAPSTLYPVKVQTAYMADIIKAFVQICFQ